MPRAFKLSSNLGNAGIGFLFFIAIIIVVLVMWPVEVSPPPEQDCIAGDPPAKEETIVMPAILNQYEAPRLGQAPDLSLGGPSPTEKVEYQLIRSNVPTAKESTPNGWIFLGGQEKSAVEHTINIGEVPEKPGYDVYYPSEWGEMDLVKSGLRVYIRRQGLLIFVNNDPSLILEKDGKHLYLAEVYQDKRVLNEPDKPYETNDLFLCFPDTEVKPPSLTIPEQKVSSDKEQLQLQWLYLQRSNYWGVHCKPAVYLYPPKKTLVNVKVHPAGYLMYTDPIYDSVKGWNIEAYPDGSLVNMNGNNRDPFSYLYFESKVRDEVIEKPTKGWVVKSNATDSARESAGLSPAGMTGDEWFDNQEILFKDILPKIGLSSEQEKDFIDYWKKALHYSPYYFIGIIDQNNVDKIERLDISPKPDSVNRVRIFFEQLDAPKDVEAPIIENNPFAVDSTKFKVVEWGGMVKNDPNHPFTCSQ